MKTFSKIGFIVILSFSCFIEAFGQMGNDSINPGFELSGPDNSFAFSASDTNRFNYVKDEFLVNSGCGEYGANQYWPGIATNNAGVSLTAWIDERDGRKEIYAQFFDAEGNKGGENILVSDKPNNWNSQPTVSANGDGGFVIVWAQTSSSVYGQLFTKERIKNGGNFIVSTSYNTNYPAAAFNEDGDFVVCWTSRKSGNTTLIGRGFDKNGQAKGTEFTLSDYQNFSVYASRRQVAYLGNDKFAATWYQKNQTIGEIKFQVFNIFGETEGGRQTVGTIDSSNTASRTAISAIQSGRCLISWIDLKTYYYPSERKVFGRIYNSNSNQFSNLIQISDSAYTDGFELSITNNQDDTFLVLFATGAKTKGQFINTAGITVGDNITLARNLSWSWRSYAPSYENKINFVYDWYTETDRNINYSQLDQNLNENFIREKINDDACSANQIQPVVHYNKLGQSIVLWYDKRNGKQDLFAQVYDKNNNAVGGALVINDSSYINYQANYVVKSLSDGNFVIGFVLGARYNQTYIFLQVVSPQGEKIGLNKHVSNVSAYDRHILELGIGYNDDILICWYERNSQAAYLKKYDSEFNIVRETTKFVSYTSGSQQREIGFFVNDSLNILRSWKEYKAYALLFDSKGKVISDTIVVADGHYLFDNLKGYLSNSGNLAFTWGHYSRISIQRIYPKTGERYRNEYRKSRYSDALLKVLFLEDRKLLVTWVDNSDMKAVFLNDYNLSNTEYFLHSFGPDPRSGYENYTNYGTGFYKDKMFLAYESNKLPNTGIDIFAKIYDMGTLDLKKELTRDPIYQDTVYPNFPNPFNSATKIAFDLKRDGKVKITIYDTAGRRIKTVLNAFRQAGYHELELNFTQLASGVYFYKFEAGTTSVHKMIILK
jgi:Secretion system C-terminal sorting domain